MKAGGLSMDAKTFGQLTDEKAFGPELDKLIYLALGQPPWTRSGRASGLGSRNCWWKLWHGVRKLCS